MGFIYKIICVYHAINLDNVLNATIHYVYRVNKLSNTIQNNLNVYVLMINSKRVIRANKKVDLALELLLVSVLVF